MVGSGGSRKSQLGSREAQLMMTCQVAMLPTASCRSMLSCHMACGLLIRRFHHSSRLTTLNADTTPAPRTSAVPTTSLASQAPTALSVMGAAACAQLALSAWLLELQAQVLVCLAVRERISPLLARANASPVLRGSINHSRANSHAPFAAPPPTRLTATLRRAPPPAQAAHLEAIAMLAGLPVCAALASMQSMGYRQTAKATTLVSSALLACISQA